MLRSIPLHIAALFLFFTLGAQAEEPKADESKTGGGSKELHDIMLDSAKQSVRMPMSGDVDKDFAKMMADHHRSGIKMAETEVRHGKNEEVKQLAQKIKKSQEDELALLERHAKTDQQRRG